MFLILGQINPVHTIISCIFTAYFNTHYPSMSRSTGCPIEIIAVCATKSLKPLQFSLYSDSTTCWTIRGSNPSRTKENYVFSTTFRPALEPTHSPIQWISTDLSPGVKQPGRAGDRSSPSSAIMACTVTILPGLPDYEIICHTFIIYLVLSTFLVHFTLTTLTPNDL
jgi:hypothetical protein